MLLSATQQFHRISIAAAGSDIMRDCGIDEKSMGDLFAVFLFTYTLMMTPGGFFIDRAGAWWSLLIVTGGSAVFGAMTAGAGWLVTGAAAWWWIAAARAAMGILSAPLYPATSRTVASWFAPRQRVLANSLVIGAALFGVAASQKVVSALSQAIGWQRAFFLAGVATLGVMALWGAAGREAPAAAACRPAAATGAWRRLFRHPGVLLLTLSYGAVGYFEYLFFYWSKHYFKEILRLDEGESAYYAAIPNLAMMVLTPAGGLLSVGLVRRFGLRAGLRATAMGAMGFAALFLALGALTEGLAAKVCLLALALGAIGASEGPFWTAAIHLGGPAGGAAGGFFNTGGNLLGILAPMLTPRIAAAVNASAWSAGDPLRGWTVALLAGSAVAVAGMVLWLWVDVDRPLA
jgi:hypothetical protein